MKSSPFEQCTAYIEAQGVAEGSPTLLPLITISRQCGTGAVPIAHLVADELNHDFRESGTRPWTVFDRNLVQRVLEDHRLPKTLERFMPEDVRVGIHDTLEELLGLHPSSWKLAEHTANTILRLAHLGHCILVGRGATVITANMPLAFHVRLVAPPSYRIQQIAADRCLTELEAEHYVSVTDRARQRYVSRYHNAKLTNEAMYDLSLNCARFSPSAAAHVICAGLKCFLAGRENMQPPPINP
jgi:cytidylate kinase